MAPRLLAAAALAALAVAAPACGTSDEEEVRQTLDRFETATAERDYGALCDDLLARELIARLRAVGLPCRVALARALGSVERPRLTIERIRVTGDTAAARITTTARGQRPSQDVIRLVRQDGEWRISSLSGTEPPSPPRNPLGEPEHTD